MLMLHKEWQKYFNALYDAKKVNSGQVYVVKQGAVRVPLLSHHNVTFW